MFVIECREYIKKNRNPNHMAMSALLEFIVRNISCDERVEKITKFPHLTMACAIILYDHFKANIPHLTKYGHKFRWLWGFRISQVYLCFANIAFYAPNSAPICASCKRSGRVLFAPHRLFDIKRQLKCTVYTTEIYIR